MAHGEHSIAKILVLYGNSERVGTNFHSTALQGEQSNVKILVMSRYKFGLAIENTRDPDYITEKLFEVVCCG